MPVTVVLAIGFDPWLFESQRTAWQSTGHFVTPAGTVSEAISHFRDGDFDAVLLGGTLPPKSRERIISLIRSAGSSIPVLCVTEASNNCQACEFAAIKKEPAALMQRIGELLASPLRKPAGSVVEASELGSSPLSRPQRVMESSRSGVKRRAQRASDSEFDIEQLPLLTDSSCFTICFQPASPANVKVGGANVEAGNISAG